MKNEKQIYRVSRFLVNKQNQEKRIAYSVAYEPNVVDLQGDFMDIESIEEMAHQFMLDCQTMNKMHEEDVDKNEIALVESWIQMKDTSIDGEWIKKGSWVVGIKFNEELWKKVKSGEWTGVSIGGIGWEVDE